MVRLAGDPLEASVLKAALTPARSPGRAISIVDELLTPFDKVYIVFR